MNNEQISHIGLINKQISNLPQLFGMHIMFLEDTKSLVESKEDKQKLEDGIQKFHKINALLAEILSAGPVVKI